MPFEVSETGWGEFELLIKIYFQDPNERPVSVNKVVDASPLCFSIHSFNKFLFY